MHGPARDTAPPPGPRYRRHLAEQPSASVPDPFASGTDDTGPRPGPEFCATHDSECDASVCLGDGYIWEGDHIRATGTGGYAHSDCIEEEDARG